MFAVCVNHRGVTFGSTENSPNISGQSSHFFSSLDSQYPPMYLNVPFLLSFWNHLGFQPFSCNLRDCTKETITMSSYRLWQGSLQSVPFVTWRRQKVICIDLAFPVRTILRPLSFLNYILGVKQLKQKFSLELYPVRKSVRSREWRWDDV